jgi:hypothetical protein
MAPPPPKQIVVSDKQINGPIHAVPCPWCGKPNNFKNLQEAIGATFEAGNQCWCDHCHHLIVVTKVVPVTVVAVRQSKNTGLDPELGAAPQPAASPAPRPTNPLAALLKR